LLFKQFRVIHVMTAQSAAPRRFKMQTFSIDNDNNISVFAPQEEAAAATATPFDSFASQQELADLAAGWPAERLLAVWNSLPGVTPVKKFTDRKTAISRIWARIEGLGEPVPGTPATTPERKTDQPAKGKTEGQTWRTVRQGRGRPQERAQGQESRQGEGRRGPREGSKTAGWWPRCNARGAPPFPSS
jgi:hypothetical protein